MKSSNKKEADFSVLQEKLLAYLSDYKDVLYTSETQGNQSQIRNLISLHSYNHVLKQRKKILESNESLKAINEQSDPVEIRDQGFTRPTVLILVPFRNAAFEIVNKLIELSGTKQQVIILTVGKQKTIFGRIWLRARRTRYKKTKFE